MANHPNRAVKSATLTKVDPHGKQWRIETPLGAYVFSNELDAHRVASIFDEARFPLCKLWYDVPTEYSAMISVPLRDFCRDEEHGHDGFAITIAAGNSLEEAKRDAVEQLSFWQRRFKAGEIIIRQRGRANWQVSKYESESWSDEANGK